jgi:hypothetical protein
MSKVQDISIFSYIRNPQSTVFCEYGSIMHYFPAATKMRSNTVVCRPSRVYLVQQLGYWMDGLGFKHSECPDQFGGPTSLLQWETRALFSKAKHLRHKADYSPPPSAKSKNECSYTSTSPTVTTLQFYIVFYNLHSFQYSSHSMKKCT